MGMKKLPPSKDRIAELEEKTQKMLDRLGPDQVKFEKTFSYLNGDASFRWPFGPHSAWGSKESTTILTTHPSLPLQRSLDVCMNIKNFHSG